MKHQRLALYVTSLMNWISTYIYTYIRLCDKKNLKMLPIWYSLISRVSIPLILMAHYDSWDFPLKLVQVPFAHAKTYKGLTFIILSHRKSLHNLGCIRKETGLGIFCGQETSSRPIFRVSGDCIYALGPLCVLFAKGAMFGRSEKGDSTGCVSVLRFVLGTT